MFVLVSWTEYKRLINEKKSKKNEFITKSEALDILDKASLFKIEAKKLFRFWFKNKVKHG